MKKGSITVFLSLILVLLFSFLLTTLEGARIRGATAYLSMVSELAGDSFLASYYYPLFQNYRLFGVDMGDEEGDFPPEAIEESLLENMNYGMSGLDGGLLKFHGTELTTLDYETMLSNEEDEFLSQIKQQVVLDGMSLALGELFSEEQFAEAGMIGEIYREQEEALAATATVTTELIKLMELVDGICMGKGGISFDKNGKMQASESFIKQLVSMEKEELIASYDNKGVFRTTSGGFFRADRAADRIIQLLSRAEELESDLERSGQLISQYEVRWKELAGQWEEKKKQGQEALENLKSEMASVWEARVAEKEKYSEYENSRATAISDAKKLYQELKEKLEAVQFLLKDALGVVEELEKKQRIARVTVQAYEGFLDGIKNSVSGDLYQVFLKELEKMQMYAGLDERGFSTGQIRETLKTDKTLLEELSLKGFSEKTWEQMKEELAAVKSRMKEYTVEGLWFSYGNITVAEQTWENVTGFLSELLSTGILSLVGIPKEEQSDRSLTGTELPSAGLKNEQLFGELLASIEEVRGLFQGGSIGDVLKKSGAAVLDETALELYSMKYFHRYGEEAPDTKLNYEREYLIFGAEEDKANLLSMVLFLVAVRTLFSMVMIIKQPDRMAELEALSVGVAGFTGIPVLAAVVKYGALLLWSVEEALVEVSALLQGKRIPVIGMGTVAFGELFSMNTAAIKSKSQRIPDGIGGAYQDYLTLLSLTKGTTQKCYRAMDLIQENIRYRYRDSFRIRNVITRIEFSVKTRLNPMFDTGVFPDNVYESKCRTAKEY